MLDAIDEAEHTIDFLTFVYWDGEIGTEFAERLAARARAGRAGPRAARRLGRPPDRPPAGRPDGGRPACSVRWFRPLRRLRPTQLNHRTHRKVMIVDEAVGVHRRRRHRRRVAGRRPRRARVARHPLPASGARRSTACAPRSSTTGPRPTRCSSTTSIDRFPDQPKPGTAVVQCVRSASEHGWSDVATLFRTLLQLAEHAGAHHDRLLRARRRADRPAVRRRRPGRARCEILLPGPHADKRFVQLAGERRYAELLDARHRDLELPAVDAARQGHDRRRRSSPTSARPTSTADRSRSTRRSTSSPSTASSPPLLDAAVRRRPEPQRADRARSLAGPVVRPAGRRAPGDPGPTLLLKAPPPATRHADPSERGGGSPLR